MLYPVFAGAEELSLQQCFDLALANNPSLEIARLDALAAKEDQQQAHKDLLPALNFAASYKRQSELPKIEIPPIETPYGQAVSIFPEGGMELGSLDTYDFKITLSQPVFTGFRLTNRQKSALALADNKQYEYQRKKNELLYQVEVGYRNVQQTMQILEITRTGQKQVEQHLKDVQNFYEQGLARKDEVLKVQVKLTEAELAVMQAQNAVQLSGTYLANLIGQPVSEKPVVEQVITPQLQSVDREGTLNLAMAQRLEFQSLNSLKTAAGYAEKIVKGDYWPSVAAFASYAYGKPGLNFTSDEWMNYWVAGVGLEWKLWNWGKTGSQVQQARLKTQSIDNSIAQVRLAVRLDVDQACLQVDEVSKRLEMTGQMVSQAEESFRIVENNYKIGTAGNSDYLDAQFDLTRAQLQQARAEIDYLLALANLKRAEGDAFSTEEK